ncbi:MAG: endolytic transglycosylase MltG [Microbacterium sp.]|uniref:endolytic transglycosylase MltG n=1 Tax=Microbacterium sp. TaxID=51671 RepID=UPI0039E3DCDF
MSDTPPTSRRAAREAQQAASATPPAPEGDAGDLHDLFTGRATTDVLGSRPPAPDRRRRRRRLWIALAVVIVLLGGIAGGGLWAWDTYGDKIRDVMGWSDSTDYEDGIATGSVTVTIVSGDTGATISESLYEAGVTKTSSAFYDYLISTAQNPTFQPGVYQLQQQMSSAAALTALMDSANKLTDTVVIPEGLGYEDALQRVADATGLSYDDLLAEAADYTQFGVPAEAPSIEGFLFPATYTFDPDVTAHDAIARMVDEMFSRLDALGVAESDRLEVLTLASIVQKEAGSTDDMPKIARVFLNRIADGMPLQSDATVAYGAGLSGTVWTTEEERADTSNIYNTYVITGLPPGPISLPGEDAISAAINPADGSWLYFVAVNLQTGETVFSDTYEEHEAAVAELQAWCAESENAAYCQ